MQIFVLLLVLALFVHDGMRASDAMPPWQGTSLAGVVLLPKLTLMLLYTLLARITHQRLAQPGSLVWIRRLDRVSFAYRGLILASYGLDLHVGLLSALRLKLGDLVLFDELLVMTLPILMLLWGWWAYYPIDRRLREATLISRLDLGMPVHPVWTRGQFLLSQFRHQIALLLAPLLALLAWNELLVFKVPPQTPAAVSMALQLGGAAVIFLFAPLIIRHIWDTVPLPPGELRDMLVAMCKRHRVKVRELLLWRTFGGVINAAVMGLIAPLRYILLSDALLEMLPLRQVEAVMAHELAHVRRHHMFWLLAVAAGAAGLLQTGFAICAPLLGIGREPSALALAGIDLWWLHDPATIAAVLAILFAVCWVAIFGWVSRRFERQADTFAVQHLAFSRGVSVVDAESVAAMISALEQVAILNNIPTRRNSWRHGAIAWRQQYLRSLIGRRVDDLPIDRQIRWIKLAGAAALIGAIAVDQLRLLP